MKDPQVIRAAVFDDKLKRYWWLQGAFVCCISVIGWPLLPFWLLGLGQYVSRKGFERLQCNLTERGLHLRRGFIFRVEKNIPLDKIQDLTVNEGPLLRHLGLAALQIETAGGNAAQGAADASLTGLVDALDFRDAVLEARDRAVGAAASQISPAAAADDGQLLTDIRDSLQRIETLLAEKNC